MLNLNNKIVIITGSSGGIGKEIAKDIAQRGGHVVITSRTVETAERVAQEIVHSGGKASGASFNLQDSNSGQLLIEQTVSKFGRLDALVNNAINISTLPPLQLQDMDYEQLDQGIKHNLTNIIALSASAYQALKATKGSLLNIGSVVTNRYMHSIPLYAVIKGGLQQMTRALAAEWAKDNIRVNQINPGLVKSDAFKDKGIPQEFQDAFYDFNRQFYPIGRIGKPEDIGPLASFLLSEESAWMTGSIIDIDGGYSCQGVPTADQTMREENL